MKVRIVSLLTLLLAFSLPFSGIAAEEGNGMKGMDHGSMKKMDHGQMKDMDHGQMKDMDQGQMKDMIMIGKATEEGVKAMAHLNDVGEAMQKAGMDATHHFMTIFEDAESGKPITEGTVALKVTGPDGETRAPVRLMGMDGHFGADVVLKEKGEYTFEVGTKLPDGQKRTFEFKQTL